jgi:signal transduction histidine kinase
MTYLIEQTTIYNSIEKGKFEVRKKNFDLIKLIKSSIENFNIIKKENQKLVFDTQEKELLINTDDKLLRQSIDNLINNAIKYSPDNHDIKISVVKEFDDIILRVQDEGVGIPEQDQKKLFDAFHRSSNVNGIPGTGLGLSITKKFVESLGGRMKFSSKEN